MSLAFLSLFACGFAGGTSAPGVPQDAHRGATAQGQRACPVERCPRLGTAEFVALPPGERAICDPDDWALKQIGMGRVFSDPLQSGLTGWGVTIAHIDTGYTDHPALPIAATPAPDGWPRSDSALRLLGAGRRDFDSEGFRHGLAPAAGFNFQDGCPDVEQCGPRDPRARIDPRDPLKAAPLGLPFRQPGHGTGTVGMITAPGVWLSGGARHADRFLLGTAPGALVIPFRIANGVILSEGRSTRLVEAFFSALSTQTRTRDQAGQARYRRSADVITISFGRRSPSAEMEDAVLTAERHGVIVVAATGEYPFWSPVRFPAQYPTVIGVTGTRVGGGPWSGIFGAGRGRTAKIAAPAFHVWHAETKKKDGVDCPTAVTGKGTSFSAPLAAGAAALWLEKHNTPDGPEGMGSLDKNYGSAAVPALFRYFLRGRDHKGAEHPHAFRSPKELCELARLEAWPNAGDVCGRASESWDTERWGQGILAVDKLLSLDADKDFPPAKALCADVYFLEGIAAWERACPMGSPGRDPEDADKLLEGRPAQTPHEKWTRVAGASWGRPFGERGGVGPALDYGIIFSQHHYHAPRGLLVQGKSSAGVNISVGVGYGGGFGYDPFRDSKQSVSVIPGFGPAAGYGIKAVYAWARSDGQEHANMWGVEGQVVLLKVKASFGKLWDTRTRRWRTTWELGFGY